MSGPISPTYTGWNVPTGGGSGRLYVSGSLVATFDDSGSSLTLPGALTVSAGGLTVSAGTTIIVGTMSVDVSCASLTISGLPTAACCLGSGCLYVGLSGCCCCIGTVMIVP